jgi:HEPN domain-containing protein
MKKASGQWLESAEMDLGSIDQIIQREDLTPVAAFHSQQCVEKCFKAVLEEYTQKVPREHSTLKLYGLVRELISLEVDREILTDLDDLYIESRYPGEFGLLPNGKPTREDAQRFYQFAQSLCRQVKQMLEAGH